VADVAYLELEAPASATPLIAPQAGMRWRFADGRAGSGMVVSVAGHHLMLDHANVRSAEPGAALVAQEPWGAIFGIVLGGESPYLRAAAVDIESTDEALRDPSPAPLTPAELGVEFHPVIHRYVPRDIDALLDRALSRPGLVVLSGRPNSGKTRTLWEAIVRSPRGPAAFAWLGNIDFDAAVPPADGHTMLATTTNETFGTTILGATVYGFGDGLTRTELDRAWELLGPVLDLVPDAPWTTDELDMRARAVTRTREERDRQRLARALFGYGEALRRRGRLDEAVQALEESLALWRERGDLAGLADRLLALGGAYEWLGQREEAIAVTGDGVSARRQQGEVEPLFWALLQLAQQLSGAGRLEEALRVAEEAVARSRDDVDSERGEERLAEALEMLSRILADMGDDAAIAAAEEAAEQQRDPVRQAYGMTNLAMIHERLGRPVDAVAATRSAVERFRERHDVRELVTQLGNLARQSLAAGDLETALGASEEAIGLARDAPDPEASWVPEALAFQLLQQARNLDAAGRKLEALDAVSESVDRWAQLSAAKPAQRAWYGSALNLAIDLARRTGDLGRAIAYAEAQVALLEQIDDAQQRDSAREQLAALRSRLEPM
jgi:tetratricopeptide (TPR) repeat protein